MNAWEQAVSVIVSNEQLVMLANTFQVAADMILTIRLTDPDLAPELDAILDRLSETLDHVLAAQAVLAAKVENLRDTIKEG